MIRCFYPLLAGGFWGLTKLPHPAWWLGVLGAGFYLATLKNCKSPWALFSFVFVELAVTQSWVLDTLSQLKNDFWDSFGLYCSTLLWLSIPLFLALLFVNGTLSLIRSDSEQRAYYRYLCFPFAHFLGLQLLPLFALGNLPLLSLADQPLLQSWFSGAYPLLGGEGVEALASSFFMLILLPLISKADPKTLFTLPWTPLLVLIFLSFAGRFPPKKGPILQAAVMPWNGTLGTAPTTEAVINDLFAKKKALGPHQPDLFILPETALPGFVGQGNALDVLAHRFLEPSQSLLTGVMEQRLAGSQFNYFNSALLLAPLPGLNYQLSQKETLLPLAEYMPAWARFMGVAPLIPRSFEYSPGKRELLEVQGLKIAVGICFEQYLDSFYRQSQEADLLIILSRQFELAPEGKKALSRRAVSLSLQSLKTVLVAANGGISGVVAGKYKQENLGTWIPQALTGLYPVRGQSRVSLYYSWGDFLTPLILLGCFSLILGAAYRPFYGQSIR